MKGHLIHDHQVGIISTIVFIALFVLILWLMSERGDKPPFWILEIL